MLRSILCFGSLLPLATSGCTLLGMGIGARVDYKHNTIDPGEARAETGTDVIVEVREEDTFHASWEAQQAWASPISGPLSASTRTEGSEWRLVCVDGEAKCVPGDQVDVVERRDPSSAGFWIGTGAGAVLDLAIAALFIVCSGSGGCFAPSE